MAQTWRRIEMETIPGQAKFAMEFDTTYKISWSNSHVSLGSHRWRELCSKGKMVLFCYAENSSLHRDKAYWYRGVQVKIIHTNVISEIQPRPFRKKKRQRNINNSFICVEFTKYKCKHNICTYIAYCPFNDWWKHVNFEIVGDLPW